MKKEKQVKSYTKKIKSGKVVVVKAHTAKYDAADEKKREPRKRKGAGEEFDIYRAATGTNPFYFRDWYNFNEWDTPEKTWPASVREADAQIKRNLKTKEAYDKYCDHVDKNWREYGYVDYHPIHRMKKQ